jgi:hypothetical protein
VEATNPTRYEPRWQVFSRSRSSGRGRRLYGRHVTREGQTGPMLGQGTSTLKSYRRRPPRLSRAMLVHEGMALVQAGTTMLQEWIDSD